MTRTALIPKPGTIVILICAVASLAGCDDIASDEPITGSGGSAGDDIQTINTNDFDEALASRPAPQSCDAVDLNDWVHRSMLDYYLFYDQVDKNINTAQYATQEELIADLRVLPYDQFSYVTEESTYEAFFSEGETFGYGWHFARNENNALLFALIEPNSPLFLSGVQRGEELLAINGIGLNEFLDQSASEINDVLGTGDEVRTLDLSIGNQNGESREVTVTKATYSLQTVLDSNVIVRDGVSIAYLSFYQFINNSSEELKDAFELFAQAGVSELVLDLRFNSGGRINVAAELASYMVGDNHQNDVFTTFAFNQKYDDKNVSWNFQNMNDALSLNRIFVLQSGSTCSASELVVNSLRPYMEVITVGDTSCGKPYATMPNTACSKVINALEIELVNADGVGDYYDGISADCSVAEDLSYALGNESEPLLSTALDYLTQGGCNLTAKRSNPSELKLIPLFRQGIIGGNILD